MDSVIKPSTAIARVLRGLGLKQGTDFRVRGQYKSGERVGTYVAALTNKADDVIAKRADDIERLAGEMGAHFVVSVNYTDTGRVWTWIANYGERVRETPRMPVALADAAYLSIFGGETARYAANYSSTPEQMRPLTGNLSGRESVSDPEQLDAFDSSLFKLFDMMGKAARGEIKTKNHPYDGLSQKVVGALTWACQEPGQVWFFQNNRTSPRYTLRRYRGSWYLSGVGIAPEGQCVGLSFSAAAEAAEELILDAKPLADAWEDVQFRFPKGTRVQGLDAAGVTRMGVVTGDGWGVVDVPESGNHGRAWVDVVWTLYTGNQRGRAYADDLIKL